VLPGGRVLALHQLPSGVSYPDKLNVIGHGTLVDPVRLREEIADAESKGLRVTPENLAISDMAHMVLPHHKVFDAARETGKSAQGTTKAGISFAASDKSLREGLRVESILSKSEEDLSAYALGKLNSAANSQALAEEFAVAATKLKPFIKDTPGLLNELLNGGEDVLIEGAQAYGLDINHGKYPYTTSTGTTVPALIDGTGINPKRAGKVIGVAKATPSKVGE
jgi:adenylosuccinate synthase